MKHLMEGRGERMKKKQLRAAGMMFALILCTGCKKEAGEDAIPEEKTVTESLGKNPSPSATREPDGWSSLNFEETKKEVNTDISGKVFGTMKRIGEDDEYYCNLLDNIALQGGLDLREQVQGLVCSDPVYGITYYVNCGRDSYIYAIKDGKNMLAVEMPATDLYCRDGVLYFLLRGYGEYSLPKEQEGTVFSYDPVNGEVTQVTKQQGDFVQVYPDGIVINKVEDIPANNDQTLFSVKSSFWFYSFENQSECPLSIKMEVPDGWKGSLANTDRLNGVFQYSVSEKEPEDSERVQELRKTGYQGDLYRVKERRSVDRFGKQQGVLKNYPYASFCRVREGRLFYVGKREENGKNIWSLMSYSMTEDETNVFIDLAALFEGRFTMIGDVCYFSGNGGCRVSLTDGRQDYLQIKELHNLDVENAAFYTDGERIFLYDGMKMWEYREKYKGGETLSPFGDCFIGGYKYELVAVGENYTP